jgi:hypothetical protein
MVRHMLSLPILRVESESGAWLLLTLFSVEHMNALDRAVVGNPLAEPPRTGRSKRLGGRSNRLGQEAR